MKIKLMLSIFILSFMSCTTVTNNTDKKIDEHFSIRVIDGCEYIQFENGIMTFNSYSYTLTHKGDCKNPIHKCKCSGN